MNLPTAPVLPPHALDIDLNVQLDGRDGTNRALGQRAQIAAQSDVDAIRAWLACFMDRPATFSSYRKEAERLLLWANHALEKPLSSLTHEDLLRYQRFLADPQPESRWVLPRGRKVSRAHPDWRPFAGPLAPASRRQAVVILNTMFGWLVSAGYLSGNPLSLSRQRTRKAAPRITRYLDDTAWAEVRATIEALPQDTPRALEHYARMRWLFSLMYLCGVRISEITENTMGGFFCRRDRDGTERWWLEVTGKGDKTRIIPATRELMTELARYRSVKGYTPFPAAGEPTPLLLPIGDQVRPLTRAAIHTLVKQVFARTAARLQEQGPDYLSLARHVEQASAHWMRHTAGSHMANSDMDLRHIRDNLGHESISTTNLYLHSSDNERHQATEESHRLGW